MRSGKLMNDRGSLNRGRMSFIAGEAYDVDEDEDETEVCRRMRVMA